MRFEISVGLFLKPAWELSIEEKVDTNEIRELAEEMGPRLKSAADTIDRLVALGWETCGTLYDVNMYPPTELKWQDEADFISYLKRNGFDPEHTNYTELEWEDDEEPEHFPSGSEGNVGEEKS